MRRSRSREIILGVTGSIASYKACELISLLRKNGFAVTPVMTKEACEFITPKTLETLASNKVHIDLFSSPEEWDPLHTSLADRAEIVLIAPATANVIGKLANGICDDILTCVILSTKAPVLIAPAMNDNMYRNSILQDNIARLKKVGYRFCGPVRGHLVCGREGIGHLASVEAIVRETKKILEK